MKNKLTLFTLIALVTILSLTSLASAYSLSIASIEKDTLNEPFAGVEGVIHITIANAAGSGNLPANQVTAVIYMDAGTGSDFSFTLPAIAQGDNYTLSVQHTYSSAGNKTIEVEEEFGWAASSIGQGEIEITNPPFPPSFNVPTVDLGSVPTGFSNSESVTIENNGSINAQVNVECSDLIDSTASISCDVAVAGSNNPFLFFSDTTKITTLSVDTNGVTPGNYTGNLSVCVVNGNCTNSTVTLEVIDNNFGGAGTNTAPVIDSISDQTITVNQPFTYTVTADDPENTPFSFSLTQNPTGLTIDSQSGELSWTPSATGTYDVTVSATDDLGASSSESFQIDVLPPTGDLNIITSEIEFGGSNQQREQTISQTITIENNGNGPLTLTGMSSTAASSYDIEINTTLNTPVTINSGTTTTITVDAYVPADKDSLNEHIGTLSIQGEDGQGTTLQDSVELWMEAESFLSITDVEDDSSDNNLDELQRGDTVRLEVTVENSGSTDMEDVCIYIEDSENDWDVEIDCDDAEIGDVDNGDEESITIEFDVPTDADNGAVSNFIIRTKGKDADEGFWNYADDDSMEDELEVELPDYTLEITQAIFDNSQISSNTNQVRLDVTVENTGLEDLEDVVVEVSCSSLDFYANKAFNSDINDGQEEDTYFTIQIPSSAQIGTHSCTVYAYDDEESEAEDSRTAQLTIASSTPTSTTTSGSQGVVVTSNQDPTTDYTGTGIANPVYGETASLTDRFTETKAYLYVLAALSILGLAGVSILVMDAAQAKKKAGKRQAKGQQKNAAKKPVTQNVKVTKKKAATKTSHKKTRKSRK